MGGGTGFNNKSPLYLGSAIADNVVTLQNNVALNNNRTVRVYDNPDTPNDYAVISGIISDGSRALDLNDFVFTDLGGMQNGTYLMLDFTRENPYVPAKLYVEYGTDLTGWTTLEFPATSQTIGGDIDVVVTAGPPDAMTVKIPIATHAVGGKLFARLVATEN